MRKDWKELRGKHWTGDIEILGIRDAGTKAGLRNSQVDSATYMEGTQAVSRDEKSWVGA